jgi:HEPN domain-containing protein
MIFAEDDLKIVFTLWRKKEKIHRGICFHAQQYAEKIVKGILEFNNIKPPKIHDIFSLSEKCKELNINIPLTEEELQFLTSVYIDVRYPPDVGLLPNGEPTEEHSKYAYEIVKKLNKWIEKQL